MINSLNLNSSRAAIHHLKEVGVFSTEIKMVPQATVVKPFL